MASPAIFDLAKLTAPIPGANPCGVDLRTDPAKLAVAVEDGVEGAEDASQPDWKVVLQPAVKSLSEKSKDLEIAAYLIEASARVNGFAGLRDGFRLTRELVEKYWETLFPMPDEEGLDTRLFALIGLNGDDAEGTLIAPINRIPVTEAKGEGPYATYHYQEGQKTAKITDPKVKEKKIAANAMTLEKLAKAVSESSNAFYKNLVEDLNAALDELSKLGTALDGKCGGKAPAWGQVRNALTACLDAVKDFARHKLEVAVPKEEGKSDDGTPAVGGAAPKKSGDLLQSRDDAFTLLTKVADFFRRTEPHSFVSYAVEQAVRWGRMPLPELLAELIAEEPSRKALYKQVGIRPPEPAKDEKKK